MEEPKIGLYDTFIEMNIYGEEIEVQCKTYYPFLNRYYVGDEVPKIDGFADTYTIFLPDYEARRFILIKKQKFVGLTSKIKETWPPYISKHGEPMYKKEVVKYVTRRK